jgi:hypothetical protein
MTDNTNRGWICPKCERVYAPFVPTCAACNRAVGGQVADPNEAAMATKRAYDALLDDALDLAFGQSARTENAFTDDSYRAAGMTLAADNRTHL